MGEDFIRKTKDGYRRSQQERLGGAFSIDNLFDSSEPPTTLYPCVANDVFPVPEPGTTLALYLDDRGVHVLEGHRIVGVVQPEATEDLSADRAMRGRNPSAASAAEVARGGASCPASQQPLPFWP
jgi:hypothetical protein